MATQSTFGYDDTPEGSQAHNSSQGADVPLSGQYKFSSEELRVLQECNEESFYQRSLPIGTVLGLGTYAAIQQGYLRGNLRFGAFPKVTLAVIVGYFIGKISYQNQCAEKLMAVPGSYIGQLLKDKKEGRVSVKQSPTPPTMFGANQTDIYSDAGPGNSLNLDTDRPMYNDDMYRPSGDVGPPPYPDDKLSAKDRVTYDELRRRNREQSAEVKQDPYKTEYSGIPVVMRKTSPPPPSHNTNKYGDELE